MPKTNDKKLLIIGSEELITIFQAIGAEIYNCQKPEEAFTKILDLKNDSHSDYGVILISNALTGQWPDTYFDQLTGTGLPAVISIPDLTGKSDLDKLRRLTERAIGSDISDTQ
ncbi:MAG: V-type ATP synthase subunit F [Patescibacteria group bacterium]